ncbi:MAG TPA: transposase [Myxococcales bacterium]|nr:transposase [Myxococcales bacterium]
MKSARQTAFLFRAHGGWRRGAGRKRKGERALVSHKKRPRFEKATPAHVTLRVMDNVPSLRSSRRFAAIRRCFAAARGMHGLRLVEFTVMGNHLHLIVEAENSGALSRGMQGLCIRLAKAMNRALKGRAGRVFADHYHSHLLGTPTEVRNALRYVSGNAEHHFGAEGLDWFSSQNPELRALLEVPETWLLTVGFRRGRPAGG